MSNMYMYMSPPIIRIYSIWSMASIGSSTIRKYMEGTGEDWLSFRMPLKILWWKVVIGFIWLNLRGSAASPKLKIGWQ